MSSTEALPNKILPNNDLGIIEEIEKDHEKDHNSEITKFTNKFIERMTKNLDSFGYNKLIANMHEMYSFLIKQVEYKYKKTTLKENYEKILIAINPIVPHISNECLEMINSEKISWPKYDLSLLRDEKIKIVIQINGKKRGLVESKIDADEENIFNMIQSDQKIMKYLDKITIKKKIYIKDKQKYINK